MATFTKDNEMIRSEFNNLKSYFDKIKIHFNVNEFKTMIYGNERRLPY